jgi:hypothetical protein
MTKLIRTTIIAALLTAAPLALACDYPTRADVPDGATATKEEMISGQRSVKGYMQAMEAYLACIEAEEQEAVAELGDIDDEALLQRTELFNAKYNAAVEEMNLVAEEFNMQVRAYKEMNP